MPNSNESIDALGDQHLPSVDGWYWARPRASAARNTNPQPECVFLCYLGEPDERIGVVWRAALQSGGRSRVEDFIWVARVAPPSTVETSVATLEAVLHQLCSGEAGEGDPRDLQWCAGEIEKLLEAWHDPVP